MNADEVKVGNTYAWNSVGGKVKVRIDYRIGESDQFMAYRLDSGTQTIVYAIDLSE